MSESQVAMAEGLCVDLLELFGKMGRAKDKPEWAKYAKWNEAEIHNIMAKTRRVARARESWSDYSALELARCITQMKRFKIQYGTAWREYWQASLEEDEKIMADCYPYARSAAWMVANPGGAHLLECFEWVKRIRGENYYRLRPRRIKLYTTHEAWVWLDQYAPGRELEDMFLRHDAPGDVFYQARYYYNAQLQQWVKTEGLE